MEKKILYSCDTGVDDALALAYLAAQKDCQAEMPYSLAYFSTIG